MRRSNLGFCGLVLAVHVAASTHAFGQSAARRDPFVDPASGPLSLKEVLDLVNSVKQGVESEGRVIRAIDARGVDFTFTVQSQSRLEQAGASARVTDLVRKKAPAPVSTPAPPPSPPPPPATPPPVQPTGTLTLHCEPSECEVSVEGGPVISTTHGSVSIPGLKIGEVVVDVRKQGYFGQQPSLVIRANLETSLAVTLEPDNPTRAEFGKRLFEAMRQAVGGTADHRAQLAFSTTGSATVIDRAGTSSEWNFSAAFRPGQASLEVRGVAGRLKLDCRGETCQANSGKKPAIKGLSPEHTLAVETGLRQFRSWQFAALADRLFSDEMRPTSKSADLTGSVEQSLRLEGRNEAFDVTLDKRLLPATVTVESKSGLDVGFTIGFADYVTLGSSQYPRTTEIKLPSSKQGVRIRLDDVHLGAGFK